MDWEVCDRGDPRARRLADRHYNRQNVGHPMFAPPGRALVLVRPAAVWVTSWPFAEYVKHEWAGAWVNSLFRREPGEQLLASELIRGAVAATRWSYGDAPPLGMITFVDAGKVRRKRDPGRCYLRAGFERVGLTRGGLVVLQMRPDAMPPADAPSGGQLVLSDPAW